MCKNEVYETTHKKDFRKWALKNHPDKKKGENTEENEQITEAFRIIVIVMIKNYGVLILIKNLKNKNPLKRKKSPEKQKSSEKQKSPEKQKSSEKQNLKFQF